MVTVSRFFAVAALVCLAIPGRAQLNGTAPVVELLWPNSNTVVEAGAFSESRNIVAKISVTQDGTPVSGLSRSDFVARIGGNDATVAASAYVNQHYWLSLRLPSQPFSGLFDLEVGLAAGDVDTALGSVAYTGGSVDHVIVLDRSDGMASGGKMVAAQNAANLYVDEVSNNDGLAIVPYDGTAAATPFDLRAVTTVPNVRGDAENYVDALTTAPGSSPASGLQEALLQRMMSTTGNQACALTLLSSDEQTSAPYWIEVKDDVAASGCPVMSIAMGADANGRVMQDIAATSFGRMLFSPTDSGTVILNVQETNLSAGDVFEYARAQSSGYQRLWRETGEVPETPDEFNFPPDQVHRLSIDGSVKRVVVLLDWVSMNDPDCDNPQISNGCFGIDLALKAMLPDGTLIDNAIPYTFEDVVSGHLGWAFEDPQPGIWTLIVNSARIYTWQDMPYQLIVSGQTDTIAELLLPDRTGERRSAGATVPLRVMVSDAQPIVEATVLAEVTRPNRSITELPLCDDGLHGDGARNDGVYGGYFETIDGSDFGPFAVRVDVEHGAVRRQALGAIALRPGFVITSAAKGLDVIFANGFDPLAPGAVCQP